MSFSALRTIETVPDWQGQVVLVRGSLNVPVRDGVVTSDFRLQQLLPTLRYLMERNARVVLVGHIGREPEESLYPVFEALQARLPITWGGSHQTHTAASVRDLLQPGDVVLFENLRQYPGETANDPAFAAELARLADAYVNDAFANMHREHASMVGVPAQLPAYAGLHVATEVTALHAAQQPASPSIFILGGAKFTTKIQLVEQYLAVYDELFIGGALAHDVLRARGYEIGQSLVSDVAGAAVPFLTDERIQVPVDVVVARADGTQATVATTDVAPTDVIFDCGPATVAFLQERIKVAQTVLWNGPLGNFEAGYRAGTEAVATAVADSAAASYVGGGDTVAAIAAIARDQDFTFISTGGGAMLAYLEHGTLPALVPLLQS